MWKFDGSSHLEVFLKVGIFLKKAEFWTRLSYICISSKKVAGRKSAASEKITPSEFFSRILLCMFWDF